MQQQTTFNDLLSHSFIAMQNSMQKISSLDIVLNLTISFFISMLIFYIYKKTFQGVLYQRSFNISLVAISMVTSLIIMTISGNLVLSLGMVGALSIVRFRTPIKDPIDLVFIFWALAVGIANGVAYFNISVIGSLFMSVVLYILTRKTSSKSPYLLVLNLPLNSKQDEILNYIKGETDSMYLKSKTITQDYIEIILELRLDGANTSFMENLQQDRGLKKATLVAYSQDLVTL